MYFYKRIFYVIVSIASLTFLSTLIIYFKGLSNFEYSIGVPTILEIKYFTPNRNQSAQIISSSDQVYQNHVPQQSNRRDEMQKRVERVKSLCKALHLGSFSWPNGTNDLNIKDPPTPLYSYFFFNREYSLAWCPVYKAGSTTWLHNMMLLKGFSEDTLQHPPTQLRYFGDFENLRIQICHRLVTNIWARQVYGDPEPGEEFNKAIKLLVVRHPFERIISAYRDKLSNSSIGLEHGTGHFYEKYGRKIVEKFRTDKTIQQIEPTFEEFVRYLTKTNLVYYSDDHWLPASLACTPCRINYDYIAKVETYMDDQEYIITDMNLTGIVMPRWQHRTNTGEGQVALGNSTASRYFSQLTKAQINSLYRQYYLDFEFFGYSYKEYLAYGKP